MLRRFSRGFIPLMLLGALACGRSSSNAPRQPVVAIELDPTSPFVALGLTQRVSAHGLKASGQTVALDDCKWSTADEGLVELTALGSVVELRGLATGETRLRVSARGLVADVALTVIDATPTRLELTPEQARIATGGTVALVAVAHLSDGTTRPVTGEAEWTSSDATIATVTNASGNRGLVSGLKQGEVDVTARWSGLQASARVAVSAATLTRLEVSPPAAILPVQTSLRLRAVALFSDATTADVTDLADWTSSLPEVATISSDGGSRGLVQALAAGETALHASYGGREAASLLTVTTATVKSVEISPAHVQLAKGTRARLNATAIFSDDTRQDVTTQATWRSTTEAVVLDESTPGAIEARAEGTGSVEATFLGFTGAAEVVVTRATLDALTLTPATLSLPIGTSGALTVIGTYSDLTTQDLTEAVTWSSSDEEVAAISNAPGSRGQVLAKKTGQATAQASLDGISGTAAISVTAARITRIDVAPPSTAIAKGTSRQLVATATFTDDSTLDVTEQAAWSSSSPPVASVSGIVSPRGLVTGLSLGQATITAALAGETGTSLVMVTPAVLVSLSIGPPDPSLPKGSTLQMSASGEYSDGSRQDVTALVTWSLADTRIAAVSNAAATTGLVTALQPGKTVLSAALSGKTASTSLTVTAPLLTGLKVIPAQLVLDHGATRQLTALAAYSDGSSLDVTQRADWTSGDPTIAGVGATSPTRGLVTAGRAGSTTVVARFEGKAANAEVTVNPPRLERIEIRPGSLSLAAGTRGQLRAFAIFADGSQEEVTAQAQWSASSAAVVVGTGATGGQVTARATGTATVTASVTSPSGQVTFASAQVTVTQALVDSLTISPTNARLAAGGELALTVRAFYSDGTSREVTAQASFVSANTSIVGLNGSTALGIRQGGPVAVTARFGGLSAVAQLTVGPAVLTKILLSPNGMLLQKGESGSFKAFGISSDGSSTDLTEQVAWASSVLSVCTVNLGQVKALGGGKSTITATHGGLSGSAVVEVQAPTLQRIAIAPPNAVLRPNLVYTNYRAFALYSDGSSRDVTNLSNWRTYNAQVAQPYSLDSDWGILAMGVGTTSLEAGFGGSSASTRVQVFNSTLTGVEASPAGARLPVGVAAKLFAVFAYSDGFATEIQNPRWRSLNPSIARIDANGVVTALSPGVAHIEVSASSAFNYFTSTVPVTVTSATLSAIELRVPARMASGLSTRLEATGTFSDGSLLDLGPSPVWSTTNQTVASIMPDVEGARLTAGSAGSVTVRATLGGVTGSAPLTVTASALSSLALSIPQSTLGFGATAPVTVEGRYADGSLLDLTHSVTYGSSSPDVALVAYGLYSNTAIPYAIGASTGTTTLTASLGGRTASRSVTVTGATLQSIALAVGDGPTSNSLVLTGAGPFQIRAVGTFSDGSRSDVTALCVFGPSKTGAGVVATLSNVYAGRVTVIGRGSQTITATYAPVFIGQPVVKGSATLTVP